MERLTDISADLAVNARWVSAVKRTGEESCAVFLAGQSATDGGFTVDRPFEDVVEEVNAELADDGGDDSDEEDEDNGDQR